MAKDPNKMSPSKAARRWRRKISSDFRVEVEPRAPDEAAADLILRDKFLGLLAGMSDSPTSSPDGLLLALEIQAMNTAVPAEARFEQFRGILRIVGAVTKDPELSQLFANSR